MKTLLPSVVRLSQFQLRMVILDLHLGVLFLAVLLMMLQFKQQHVIYVNNPADQVVDHYKNQFSKIVMPDSIQDGIIVP